MGTLPEPTPGGVNRTPPPTLIERDRRRENRRPVQGKALLSVLDGPNANARFEVTTRDLSCSGISFVLKESLKVGQLCKIQLLNNGQPTIWQTSEVIRSRPLSNGKFEMAVQIRKQI